MKSIFVILLSTISLSLFAQEKTKDHKKDHKDYKEKFMPIMTRGIGASFQKFDGLNKRIGAFPQYEKLKDHMWTLSLGSMHVINNFVSQLSVTGGSSLSGDRDKKSSALRFLSAGLDFGYDVIPADAIMLYPMVGIGAETYHAIYYKDVSAVDFNDVVLFPDTQNAIRSVKFINTFITYRFGLGFALKSPKHGGGSIGLQAGYTGSFKNKAWKSSENQTLNNAPTDGISRFSVSLVFSGGMDMMKMR